MSIHRIITAQALLLILDYAFAIPSSQARQQSIHLSIFHRHSSLSPLYNAHESSYARVRNSFLRSKTRLAYLLNQEDRFGDFQGGDVGADHGEYFVKFSVGTPPVETVAVVDMANELVLTRCNSRALHAFDSSNSLTYRNITCNSSECDLLPKWACDSSDLCSIVYSSHGFSHANSLLGSDVLIFESSNGSTLAIEDVIFGCKYDPRSTSYTQYDGILGLGFHNLSLIMQMSSITEPKFTYCLGDPSDLEAENRLVLGNGVFLQGQTTPLKIIRGRYGLVLEGISVGRKRLNISAQVFRRGQGGDGGVIIDTGTLLTFLAPNAYYSLGEELEGQLGLDMEIWPDPPYERCYKGKLNGISNFQGVTFHFARGLNVLMDVGNLFLQVEDGLFCLGVLPSPSGGVSVLGSLFQQSYSIGFHLGDMLVSFQRIDCELLEKHLSG